MVRGEKDFNKFMSLNWKTVSHYCYIIAKIEQYIIDYSILWLIWFFFI